jgi:hypothetical protein
VFGSAARGSASRAPFFGEKKPFDGGEIRKKEKKKRKSCQKGPDQFFCRVGLRLAGL